jgi:uncharacterized protein
MKCPNCDTTLVMSERQGIEIDYCPACRGVWLDRGELDKIIERSDKLQEISNYNPHNRMDDDYAYKNYEFTKHKKHGILGDLFN